MKFLLAAVLLVLPARFVLAESTASPQGQTNGPQVRKSKEYTLKASKSERLVLAIESDWNTETGLENVTSQFFRVSGGVRTLVGSETRGVGFHGETLTCVGNFLHNGRKQVLIFMVHGATFGEVFDFDGRQIKSVYNSGLYGPRVWLDCIAFGGRRLIEEDWTAREYSEPGFAIPRKRDNIVVRLMRWDGAHWSPMRFRFVGREPVPITGSPHPRARGR